MTRSLSHQWIYIYAFVTILARGRCIEDIIVRGYAATNAQALVLEPPAELYALALANYAPDNGIALPREHSSTDLLKLLLAIKFFKDNEDDIYKLKERLNNPLEGFVANYEDRLPPRNEYYIGVVNGNFVTGEGQCRKVFLAGANKYEIIEAGAGAPRLFDGKLDEHGLTGPEVVRRIMHAAANKHKLDFIRINAFAVDRQYSVLSSQLGPQGQLVFNEGTLRGLDYVMDQARKAGLKVLLVLTDYFRDDAGGPLQYMELAGATIANNPTLTKAMFYTNTAAKTYFKEYVSAILNRENTINGRTYKNDPTILGLDIINEPRCEDAMACDAMTPIPAFVTEMVDYLKQTLGIERPITVGTDGFYSVGAKAGTFGVDADGVNPYSTASAVNADFQILCQLVDFCSFNIYPDLWNQENEAFVDAWVATHSEDAVALGKPLIVKEFGMQPTDKRTAFYDTMLTSTLAQMMASRNAAGGLRGAAYWQSFVYGTRSVWWTLADGGRFGIFPFDPEAKLISRFAWQARQLSNAITCPTTIDPASPVVMKLPKCPYGREGTDCIDINECVRGTDTCSKHAACINTQGGFECKCFEGFWGNGKVCTPSFDVLQSKNKELDVINNDFYTLDTLSCIAGAQKITYPTTAPGWVYDPTGYSDTLDSSLNRVNVTLTQCKLACVAADDCTGFYWDEGLKVCGLQKGVCPYVQHTIPGCGDASQCQTTPCGSPLVSTCSYQQYTPNSPAPPIPGTYECGYAVTYIRKSVDLPSGCVAPVAK